ncbi:MAG: CDP-2,3-bis-(O-geranylgeranyl)-sn-glycerol synthase [Candidatus Hydrothermarchaeales archaeon]
MITIKSIFEALYFFLPAYVANFFAGFGSGTPLDFGKSFLDGHRILGDGVTIKGSILGIFCGVGFIVVLNLLTSSPFTEGVYIAFLLSLGAILGDAVGSFAKRRLGMEKGESAPLLDQLDFVFGGLFLASLVVAISLEWIMILVLLTPVGHLAVNVIGFSLKMKEVPW